MNKCSWPLGNGEVLEFSIVDSNTGWNKVAGLYIFAYTTDSQHWHALYVGKADDFSSRLPSHERLDEAVRKGTTHIHAVTVSHAADRDRWERMLIQHLQPPMNQQFR